MLETAQVHVGNFLRATRESLKLTQADVAARTRQSPWQRSMALTAARESCQGDWRVRAAVSAIERGQNFPGLEAMLALSNVLHIDPKEVIERARMAVVVPVDVSGLLDDEVDQRASQYFWAGDFKRALSVYDALVQKLALETSDEDKLVSRLASIEVRRAATLKRIGALISAIASAERAISLATRLPAVQAEAYVVLADLQVMRGHLPLARDAAERAIQISSSLGDRTLILAYMVKGRVAYLARDYDEARQAFIEARTQAVASGDPQHLTHIEGNIGECWLAQGRRVEGAESIRRAVDLARTQRQPTLEASWLVELGKLALEDGRVEDAHGFADDALSISIPLDHRLTVFRAEWLKHRAVLRVRPDDPDELRFRRLSDLFDQLSQHEGIEEIAEFRESALRSEPGETKVGR